MLLIASTRWLVAISVALALLVGACTDETVDDTSTPQAHASATEIPSASPTPTLEKLKFLPSAYQGEDRFDRTAPPDAAAAVQEGLRWWSSDELSAQFPPDRDYQARACVGPTVSPLVTATDWRIDTSRYAEDATLRLTPAYPRPNRPAARNLIIRAFHPDTGHEHLYERTGEPLLAGGLLSYSIRYQLPKAGRWLMVVTAGPNWGCLWFDVPPAAVHALPQTPQEAEAVGRISTRRAGQPQRPHQSFTASTIGTSERSCVVVPEGIMDDVNVRSGEWTLAAWFSFRQNWDPGRNGKIPLGPLWQEEMLPPVIWATRLDGTPTTLVHEQGYNGWAHGGDGQPGTRFFPSPVVLPHPGTWVMVVESAPNWGCFEVTVGPG